MGSDGTYVTMAVNLFQNPTITSQQAPFDQVAYTVQVAVGGVHLASFGIDGKKTGNGDSVYAKCTGAASLTYDQNLAAEIGFGNVSLSQVPASVVPGGFATRLAFTIPLSALAPCGISPDDQIALMVGSSRPATSTSSTRT